ncbi:peroxide stress protein YaaA [Haliea sp. E17]|uniref:peroxide stress protein YaaA n=1 Tax=Haliea sp. E17 TaxID=3401576 RepID=UPI003AAD0041
MLTVISPAKTLDFDTPPTTRRSTQPQFIERSAELVEDARALSPADIRSLMGVSENIAELNHRRFMNWSTPFTLDNAKQAVLAFKGDVYTGLEAETLSSEQLAFAQQHLCILSGLYGLLRPLDLMQPYRLEMGLKFANRGGKNLYEFWGDEITRQLEKQLKKSGSPVLVNLASNEYFRAVKPGELSAELITPVFKDLKNGKYKIISFFAKKARGQMARYIIDKELNDPAELKKYRLDGYRYSKADSTAHEWVFTRDTAPAAKG